MGCDIKLHIEIKIDGEWHHYGAPNIERWYKLFGLMAGVRDHKVEPICAPRGFPDDVTKITEFDYEVHCNGGHDASWFGPAEIRKLAETLNLWAFEGNVGWPGYDLEHVILNTYLFGNGFLAFRDLGVQDVRFVFWFDS